MKKKTHFPDARKHIIPLQKVKEIGIISVKSELLMKKKVLLLLNGLKGSF